MADLKKILQITPTDYDTLKSGGSITKGGVTYTLDANIIYLVDDNPTISFPVDVTSGGGVYQDLGQNKYYHIEAFNNMKTTVDFGIAYLSNQTSSSFPLVLTSSNYSSATTYTTNQVVTIQMYCTGNNWYVKVLTGTTPTSQSAVTTYSLFLREVYI